MIVIKEISNAIQDEDIISSQNISAKQSLLGESKLDLSKSKFSDSSYDIKAQDRAYLSWKNVSYYVPKKAAKTELDKLAATVDVHKGLPGEIIHDIEGKPHKQIVKDCSGYVAPQEMVAILGPSGSGKTSLLNVLSQRTFLQPGGRAEGSVMINGEVIGKGDYARLGAYVQQDDILVDVLTPRELLEFACRMRTAYDEAQIHKTVNRIIARLGIDECSDTQVGGWMRRGISGGERKRTSIGYELITEPSLLLLDEPTSGLDSSTAKRICQVLKKEASRGMTVMATIHQPAADIFFMFDRIIVLSEGYIIFNGPPKFVKDYFQGFGLKMGRFSNPADKLSSIASEPKTVLGEQNTILELHKKCCAQLQEYSELSEQAQIEIKALQGSLSSSRSHVLTRSVPLCQQYKLLLKRLYTQAFRVPIAFAALIFMAVMQGMLQASIFGGVGAEDYSQDGYHNAQISGNFIGLAYLVGSDQFITCSFAQVLKIPLARPIFIREVSNQMYGTTAYYMSMITSTVTLFIMYPIVVTLSSFYFFQFDEHSFGAFMDWMFILTLTAFAGGFWGFTFGTLMKNEVAATQMNMLFLIMFSFGAGFYANTGAQANFVVQAITYISPMRYSTELLMRRVVAGKPGGDAVLDALGFTWGSTTCVMLLIGFIFACFIAGWAVLLWKTREYSNSRFFKLPCFR